MATNLVALVVLSAVSELKRLEKLERFSMDDLMALSVTEKSLRAEYELHQLEVPEWLTDASRLISRAVQDRKADAQALRIQQLRQELRATASRDERRRLAQEELDRLEGRTKAAPDVPVTAS